MSVIQFWAITVIAILVVGFVYCTYSTKYISIDNFFVKHVVKNNPKFTHASIQPYYTTGYFLQYHCGRTVYVVKDIDIKSIYGAAIQHYVEDVCYAVGLERGSMISVVKPPNTIIIKCKPGVTILQA